VYLKEGEYTTCEQSIVNLKCLSEPVLLVDMGCYKIMQYCHGEALQEHIFHILQQSIKRQFMWQLCWLEGRNVTAMDLHNQIILSTILMNWFIALWYYFIASILWRQKLRTFLQFECLALVFAVPHYLIQSVQPSYQKMQNKAEWNWEFFRHIH
jgi:hypothetical protein